MLSPSFRLCYECKDTQGFKEYVILTKEGFHAGLISFLTDGLNIHIANLYVHEQYKHDVKVTAWLRKFKQIYAYQVVPEAVSYWKHIGAEILTKVGENKFEDIVFDEGEL